MPDIPIHYQLEHFYWGKLIINKNPEGGYRVIATSPHWDRDSANEAHQRIYLGSHNGLHLQHLKTNISINVQASQARSDVLIAFIHRSDYIDRSEFYPEYHVIRLPYALVEAYNHHYGHIISAIYPLHERLNFTALKDDCQPLHFQLPQEIPDAKQAYQNVLNYPFMQDASQRTYLLNHLLQQERVVFKTLVALKTMDALAIFSGLKQCLPPSARWRISGAVGVFQSRESQCTVQFLYDEERTKFARNTLQISLDAYRDDVTNTVYLTSNFDLPTDGEPLAPHPYTRLHELHFAHGLAELFSKLEALAEANSAPSPTDADWLASASHRLLYDDHHLQTSTERAHSLLYLLNTPYQNHHRPHDLRDIFLLALTQLRSDWLTPIIPKLINAHEDAKIWVSDDKHKQTLLNFMRIAYDQQAYQLAQWLWTLMLDDDNLILQGLQRELHIFGLLLQEHLNSDYSEKNVAQAQKILQIAYTSSKKALPALIHNILIASLEQKDPLASTIHWLTSPLLTQDLRYDFIMATLHVHVTHHISAQALLELPPKFWRVSLTDACLVLEATAPSAYRDTFYELLLRQLIKPKNTAPDLSTRALDIQQLSEAYHRAVTTSPYAMVKGGRTWQQYQHQIEQVVDFFNQLLDSAPLGTLEDDTHIPSELAEKLLINTVALRDHLAHFDKKGFFSGKHAQAEYVQAQLDALHMLFESHLPALPDEPETE